MANVLSLERRCQIIKALVEGNSIRSTARLFKADKETVMDLGVAVGLGCIKLHDQLVTGVRASYIEVDEVWTFVHVHERRKATAKKHANEFGDAYTFFAIDSESKLVPSYYTGKRTLTSATHFMQDLRDRVKGKVQMSVDGWPHWAEAVRRTFGYEGVHLGSIVKEYAKRKATGADRHYAPNRVKSTKKEVIYGRPEQEFINTKHARVLRWSRARGFRWTVGDRRRRSSRRRFPFPFPATARIVGNGSGKRARPLGW